MQPSNPVPSAYQQTFAQAKGAKAQGQPQPQPQGQGTPQGVSPKEIDTFHNILHSLSTNRESMLGHAASYIDSLMHSPGKMQESDIQMGSMSGGAPTGQAPQQGVPTPPAQ